MFYGDCARAAEAGTNEIAQHTFVTCTTKNFTALFPSNNQNLIGILQSLFIKMSDSQTHRFAYRTTPLPPASQIQIQLFCKRCEYTWGHMLYTFRIHLFICWISAPNCWVNNFFFHSFHRQSICPGIQIVVGNRALKIAEIAFLGSIHTIICWIAMEIGETLKAKNKNRDVKCSKILDLHRAPERN